MIALVVIDYLMYPQKIFIRPCEIAFLLKHKNLSTLLKLIKRKWWNPETSLSRIDFINFLSANNISQCLRLGWGTNICNVTQHFRAYFLLKYHYNLLLLGAGFFEYVWTEGIVSKYRIKIRSKRNQEGRWNSLKNMNRITRQHIQVYEISEWAQIEILNNFKCAGLPLCIQVTHWNTASLRKLQQIAIQYFETVLQSRC